MKIKGYKFPHPVYGVHDYFSIQPKYAPSIVIDDEYLVMTSNKLDMTLIPDLQTLCKSDQAEFICEVRCSDTIFRKSFISPDGSYDLKISLSELKNVVTLSFFIVAKENIPRYKNEAIIKELRGNTFYIEKGDVLGYLSEIKIDIAIKDLEVESFIRIKRKSKDRDDPNNIRYDFYNDIIHVEIPYDQFDKMNLLVKGSQYNWIFIMSVLQPALLHACYLLGDERFIDKNWHKVLEHHWERLFNMNLPAPKDMIPLFVEKMLKSSIGSLLDSLEELDSSLRSVNNY